MSGRDFLLTKGDEKIRLGTWDAGSASQRQGGHSLFNCPVLANANLVEGHTPFVVEVNDRQYLAYKRHASVVLGSLSLADEVALLENISTLRSIFAPMGIRNLSLNTLNAASDLDALARAIKLGCSVRFEYMLDLDEYLPGKISSNHKRNIKKSERAGAKITLPAEIDCMEAHIQLVNGNLLNKGIGGISTSAEFLSNLVRQGSGLLVQVTEGGDLLASTFFVANQSSAYYHSSGTSDRGKKIGAAYFLVDRMVSEMHSRSMRYLNLGGCTSDQRGLQRFKVGFRPQKRVLASTSQLLAPSGQQKVRLFFSEKVRQVCSKDLVNVYSKTLSEPQTSIEQEYTLEEVCWETLVEATAEAPELDDILVAFCRTNSRCYALSNRSGKVLAAGCLQQPGTSLGDSIFGAAISKQDGAAITGLRVVYSAFDDGVGDILVRFMEQQARMLGYKGLFCRVDHQDSVSQKCLRSAGYSFMGKEKPASANFRHGLSMFFNNESA